MRLAPLSFPRIVGLLMCCASGLCITERVPATQLYSNSGPFVGPWMSPVVRPRLPSPAEVPGKEYSHAVDTTGGGTTDAEQVIAWDGLGGVLDGLDFTGDPRPAYSTDDDVDALAGFTDALFDETFDDTAHLVFSIAGTMAVMSSGSPTAVPSAGPISLSNGRAIGGAGELSYELGGAFSPPDSQGLWAAQASINAMPTPTDIDALELWGPEPDLGGLPPVLGDTGKYSLEADSASGTSVWNRKVNFNNTITTTPYISHSTIVAAVTGLLGSPGELDTDDIDLDALMVDANFGNPHVFDASQDGSMSDRILFSIRQITDPTGYYATGSEIFWLDATGAAGYLLHGGHLWDKTYALASLRYSTEEGEGVVDLDVLEAVAVEPIPEPSGLLLMLLGLLAARRWRGHSASGSR